MMARLITQSDATKFIDERKRRGLLFRRPRKKLMFGRRIAWAENEHPESACHTVLAPMDTSTIIPRDQWPDLIAQKDEEKSWAFDLMEHHNLPCLDQGSLPYCHAISIAALMEYRRAQMGLVHVPLSWISIGGEATGWRKKGANPFYDDLPVVTKLGACPLSYQHSGGTFSLDYKRWKDGWKEERAKYRVTEFTDCMVDNGREFDALVSMALRSEPLAVGYQWWSHAIMAGFKVKYDDGKWWVMVRNNWGSDWEDDGYAWFPEGRQRGGATPDISSIAVRQMVAA